MKLRAAAALAAAAVVALAAALGWTGGLERWSYDTRLQLRGADAPPELAIVAIDDATFSELRQQWPLRRSLHARAIDRLREAGFEVFRFTWDDALHRPDVIAVRARRAFARAAARRAGGVALQGDGRG